MDAVTSVDQPLLISAVTMVEIVYLAEKGTLSRQDLDALFRLLAETESGFEVAAVDDAVARRLVEIPRDAVADPFDRMIAATALARGTPLITRDRRPAQLSEPETLW